MRQKRRLEGVIDLAFVTQQAPANAQNHGPVPGNQGTEGCLVATRDKPESSHLQPRG